jgi:hypothetical protein
MEEATDGEAAAISYFQPIPSDKGDERPATQSCIAIETIA